MQVRTTITSSGKTAVQVVKRFNHRTKVIKHIGSAENKRELDKLKKLVYHYIDITNKTVPLFPELLTQKEAQHLVTVENLIFTRTYHRFAYEFFSFFYERLGFSAIQNPILKDLSIIRLIEPVSKQASLELIREYFSIIHGHTRLYKGLKEIRAQKEQIETCAVSYAKKYLSFDFSVVFYDVTTLYFETFKEDEEAFRKPGVSKDNKSQQPQILIGLVVTKEGYPVAINLFEGNTFEGKTMLPVITKFKKKYTIQTLTVVADAAMLSFKNMEELRNNNLHYIVGARIGNLSHELIHGIATTINKTEGIFVKHQTPHGILICDYSKKRAAKDKYDREKQIQRAELRIKLGNPVSQRNRFLKEKTKKIFPLEQKQKTIEVYLLKRFLPLGWD